MTREFEKLTERLLIQEVLKGESIDKLAENFEKLKSFEWNEHQKWRGQLLRYAKRYDVDLHALLQDIRQPDTVTGGQRRYELEKIRKLFNDYAASLRDPNDASKS